MATSDKPTPPFWRPAVGMVSSPTVPIHLGILLLGLLSFLIAWILTFTVIRAAPYFGFIDKPGGRKIHANPKPLGGGVAIFWAVVLPMLAVLAVGWWGDFSQWPALKPYIGGLLESLG